MCEMERDQKVQKHNSNMKQGMCYMKHDHTDGGLIRLRVKGSGSGTHLDL